jgi:hypothetical protein
MGRVPAAEPIRWRTWPLVEYGWRSWLTPTVIVFFGTFVWYIGGGWLITLAAIVALTVCFREFFLPVTWEIGPAGLRRHTLGRTRFMSWHAVRAYQLRATGCVFYHQANPAKLDLLRSAFVPYPADEDEAICAVRQYLSHAVELPS